MKSIVDKFGMVLSIGCMIHCMLMPIVLPLLPMLGFVFDHDGHFHLYIAGVIVVIAVMAFVPGYLKHKNTNPLGLAGTGIVFILIAGILELYVDHSFMLVLTTICGSIFITAGHYLNHKYSCKCNHCKEHSCR